MRRGMRRSRVVGKRIGEEMKMFNCTHRYMYFTTHVGQQYTLRNGIHTWELLDHINQSKAVQLT